MNKPEAGKARQVKGIRTRDGAPGRSGVRTLVFAFVCLMTVFGIGGCASEGSYKVLSFFFDGVPPPKKVAGDGVRTENVNINNNNSNNAMFGTKQYKEHGPYAARLCEGCHQKGTNRLNAPIEELCFQCHVVNMDKKMVHGPLASGGCKICHEPHGSAYSYLLVAEAKEFCMYCHSRDDVMRNEAHKETGKQCTRCHDAHSSDNEYLLK